MIEKVIFGEQINKYLAGEMDRYSDIKVCDTPAILLAVGMDELPMLYTRKHLENALAKESHTKYQNTHGLSIEDLIKIPGELANPVMILDSMSRIDSVVVVTSNLDSEGRPIITAIKPNGKGIYEMHKIDSNFITSVYGRNNFTDFLQRNIESDNVLYINKNKTEKLFRVLQLQLPQGVNNLSFNTIIHQSRNISRNSAENSVKITEDKI